EIHEKIGRAMEEIYPDRREEFCEILAHHYVLSGNREKAVEYLELTNRKAAHKDAAHEAMAHFDKAMKILDELPETPSNQVRRVALLTNQSGVHQRVSRMKEYRDLLTRYEPVARDLGDQALLGAFYGRLGVCEWWFGRLDQAIERSTRARELLETLERPQELAFVTLGLQWGHLYRGDLDRALALKETTLRLLAEHPHPRTEGLAFIGASWACSFMGRWDQAVEEGQNGLRVGEKCALNHIISFAAFIMSLVHTQKGDLSRALEYAELGIQKSTTMAEKLWAQAGLQWAHAKIGDPAIGVELGKNLVPVYRATHFVPGETFMLLNTAAALRRCGDRDDAVKTCREGLELAQRAGMKFAVGSGNRLLGEIALEMNPAEAVDHFTKTMAVCDEIGAENELALALAGLGRLHKKEGNISEAREHLTRALEIFERLGTLLEPDKVREELDGLPRG
ncbi:MAG TPA: tetratricopeptide repeat protein, partial [Deltaproteobacteria bacterium]|nr:tetratricopeptide repeat protein [Deltaproteobacteria bacterium]